MVDLWMPFAMITYFLRSLFIANPSSFLREFCKGMITDNCWSLVNKTTEKCFSSHSLIYDNKYSFNIKYYLQKLWQQIWLSGYAIMAEADDRSPSDLAYCKRFFQRLDEEYSDIAYTLHSDICYEKWILLTAVTLLASMIYFTLMVLMHSETIKQILIKSVCKEKFELQSALIWNENLESVAEQAENTKENESSAVEVTVGSKEEFFECLLADVPPVESNYLQPISRKKMWITALVEKFKNHKMEKKLLLVIHFEGIRGDKNSEFVPVQPMYIESILKKKNELPSE